MAALVIDTGVPSHPEIQVVGVDFEKEVVHFRWIGGSYAGDCSDTFVVSIAEDGDKTLTQIITRLGNEMVSKLPL